MRMRINFYFKYENKVVKLTPVALSSQLLLNQTNNYLLNSFALVFII